MIEILKLIVSVLMAIGGIIGMVYFLINKERY
jgi:hypothetical protein